MKLIDQYEKNLDKFRDEQTKPFEDRAKFLVDELRKIEPRLTNFYMGNGGWWFMSSHDISCADARLYDYLPSEVRDGDYDILEKTYGKKFVKLVDELNEICNFTLDCHNLNCFSFV